ncbi:hypothetical protein Tco_1049521 [Tanacetum coccineum]
MVWTRKKMGVNRDQRAWSGGLEQKRGLPTVANIVVTNEDVGSLKRRVLQRSHIGQTLAFDYCGETIRIIRGPAGIVQVAKRLKRSDIREGGKEGVMPTQESITKLIEDAGDDDDFTRSPSLCAVRHVNGEGDIVSVSFGDMETNCQNGKFAKVVIVIKSCTPNELGDLTVTLKDLSSIIH